MGVKPTDSKKAQVRSNSPIWAFCLSTVPADRQNEPTMVGSANFLRSAEGAEPYGPPETSRKSFTKATLIK